MDVKRPLAMRRPFLHVRNLIPGVGQTNSWFANPRDSG
jgi:hypothetical protein